MRFAKVKVFCLLTVACSKAATPAVDTAASVQDAAALAADATAVVASEDATVDVAADVTVGAPEAVTP